MGRLIDVDDFKKFIKEKYKDGESTDDIKDQMLFDLSYQPTAYDVDAVVKELKQQAYQYNRRARELVEKSTEAGIHNKGKACSYEHAIDIVRKGGTE